MRGRSHGWAGALVLPFWLAAVGAAAVPGDPAAELAVADWEGSALSRRITGTVAVLAGADGSLRWEIATAPDTALGSLLSRRGRGWTVILAPAGAGTRQAWGEEWRVLEPDLARLLAATTSGTLSHGPPRQRIVVAAEPGRLRDRLAARGRGRGGPGEVLDLVRDPAGGTVVGSTRRPGTLRLSSWRRHRVRYPARESFVPLWPLAELLVFDGKSGNSGD